MYEPNEYWSRRTESRQKGIVKTVQRLDVGGGWAGISTACKEDAVWAVEVGG